MPPFIPRTGLSVPVFLRPSSGISLLHRELYPFFRAAHGKDRGRRETETVTSKKNKTKYLI